MEGWHLAVVLVVSITVGTLLILTGFLVLLFSIFARISGWKALVQRYGATIEPEGEKLTMQSMKVGPVWSRFDVTVVLSAQGMYLALEPRLMPKLWVWRPLQAIRKRPPVLIPWYEFKAPREGWLFLGWQAVQLSIGEPEMAVITFPLGLYKEMTNYLDTSAVTETGGKRH